jgi:hypothetical protein
MGFLAEKLMAPAGGIPFEGAYVTTDENTLNASSYSFTSQSFGAADTNRLVVVTVTALGLADRTLNSATIGGVSAAIHYQHSADRAIVAIISAEVPTGATGTVALTFSGTCLACKIGIWRLVVGNKSPTHGAASTGTTDPSLSATVNSGGLGIVAASARGATGDFVTSGFTERYDVSMEVGTRTAAGDFTSSATLDADVSGASGEAIAYASWGPS